MGYKYLNYKEEQKALAIVGITATMELKKRIKKCEEWLDATTLEDLKKEGFAQDRNLVVRYLGMQYIALGNAYLDMDK